MSDTEALSPCPFCGCNKDQLDMVAGIIAAAIEYAEYSHSGDPWEEDARAMGEMELDELKAKYKDYVVRMKHILFLATQE